MRNSSMDCCNISEADHGLLRKIRHQQLFILRNIYIRHLLPAFWDAAGHNFQKTQPSEP